ncbi:hypothetical protein Tco_0097560 [Tanacetum coccineum]
MFVLIHFSKFPNSKLIHVGLKHVYMVVACVVLCLLVASFSQEHLEGREGKQRARSYGREDKLLKLKLGEDHVQASLNYKAKIKTQATSMMFFIFAMFAVNTIAGDHEDHDVKDKQESQDDLNIAVPDQVLEESNLQTSNKVEVVPTSMVATYDEYGESGHGEQDDAMESGDISILNSWVGQGSPRSLQLWDTLGSGKVHILINNVRPNTFVQPGVMERMHFTIIESTRLDQGEVLEGLQHEQGLLLFRGRYFIGARSKLKEVLLSEFHYTPSAGHGGSKKKIRDEIQRRK